MHLSELGNSKYWDFMKSRQGKHIIQDATNNPYSVSGKILSVALLLAMFWSSQGSNFWSDYHNWPCFTPVKASLVNMAKVNPYSVKTWPLDIHEPLIYSNSVTSLVRYTNLLKI